MSIKFFTIIFFATLGLIIISAIIGNILEAKGVLTKEMLGSKGKTTVIAFISPYFASWHFHWPHWLYGFFSTCRLK